jgi:hypothetical protein
MPSPVYQNIVILVVRLCIRCSSEFMNVTMWEIRTFDKETLVRVYGLACPHVADGGDGLHLWRVAANVLNEQSRTADKLWSSSLLVRRGATNCSP